MTRTQTRTARRTWVFDPAHTLVEFSVKHMMFTTVRGNFGGVEGKLEVDEEHPDRSSVRVRIDADTIDTRIEKRDQHLRSADFLDVKNHPHIAFRSRRVEGAHVEEGDRFKFVGDLTIRGVTKEVELKAVYRGRGTDPWGGERAGFSADTTLDRREFGLTWNQALEAGGVLVGNDVKVHLEVQATPQDEEDEE